MCVCEKSSLINIFYKEIKIASMNNEYEILNFIIILPETIGNTNILGK